MRKLGFINNEPQEFWDDIRVPIELSDQGALNPPVVAFFKNNGAADPSTATALQFNSGGDASMADIYDFSASHSIEFWFKPEAGTTNFTSIVNKSGVWEVNYWGSSDIYVTYAGVGGLTSTSSVNVGSWNHIVVVATFGGATQSVIDMYVNGSAAGSMSGGGTVSDNASRITFNDDGTTFTIDEMVLWNVPIDVSTITERYNGGAGVAKADDGSTWGIWHFEEDGSTALDSDASSNDITIAGTLNTDYEWVSGHVGAASQGSIGVYLPHFRAGERNDYCFTAQIPHKYVEFTNLEPHVHWVKENDVSGNVVWGLEWTGATPGGTFGDTSTYTNSSSVFGPSDDSSLAYLHNITDLGQLDGSTFKFSTHIIGRIFRDGTDPSDNYPDPVVLLEFDMHYKLSKLGTEFEFHD
jgi:hypothetical protein